MKDVSLAEVTYQSSISPVIWYSDRERSPSAETLPNLTAVSNRMTLSVNVSNTPTWRVLPAIQHSQLSIDLLGFGLRLESPITDVRVRNEYQEVTFETIVDSDVTAVFTLQNEKTNNTSSDLRIKSASLGFKVRAHKPRAHFFADSLYAMVGLAGPLTISIPDSNLNLSLNFRIRPAEISKFIELRQMEFGLIVIEKATGIEFDIPEYVSGDEINSIALAYHAILARQFMWRVNDITQPTPATAEMLAWFDSLKSTEPGGCVYKLMFGPSPVTRKILGQEISLGNETVFIDDGIIENRDQIRRELAQNDGHIVPIKIRPQTRRGRYVFSNAPRPPETPWDQRIEDFIQVEDILNERLAARYHELAASTVADLEPNEVESVITRPALSEDAHLIGE